MQNIKGPITIKKGESIPQSVSSVASIQVSFSSDGKITVDNVPVRSIMDKDGNVLTIEKR